MIIEEVVNNDDDNKQVGTTTTTTTTVFWSAGNLHDKLNESTLAGTHINDDGSHEEGREEKEERNQEEKNYRGTKLSRKEYEAMKYIGILDSYLKSIKSQTVLDVDNAGIDDDNHDRNESSSKKIDQASTSPRKRETWNKCEMQKWKFKIAFFIVYTIFTIANFILIYNMYNYYALTLQIVNLSATYLLLLFAL